MEHQQEAAGDTTASLSSKLSLSDRCGASKLSHSIHRLARAAMCGLFTMGCIQEVPNLSSIAGSALRLRNLVATRCELLSLLVLVRTKPYPASLRVDRDRLLPKNKRTVYPAGITKVVLSWARLPEL